jgi:hypothetical protein
MKPFKKAQKFAEEYGNYSRAAEPKCSQLNLDFRKYG